MSIPLWALDLASQFWRAAGGPEPFPRSLRAPIWRATELAISEMPDLTLGGIRDYLERSSIPFLCEAANRALLGCVVIRHGCGVLFLDAALTANEKRFTIAHELAHYLAHYWRPLLRARKHGPLITEVMEGDRPASFVEQVRSIISGVTIRPYVHLLWRNADGRAEDLEGEAEEEADILAYSLLAPMDEIEIVLPRSAGFNDVESLGHGLCTQFGLPMAQATHYASLLVPGAPVHPLLKKLEYFVQFQSQAGN